MVNLSRRSFARLALGSMNGVLWTPPAQPSIDAITKSSGSPVDASQPPSSVMDVPDADPPSEDIRWDRNGFRSARPGKKLRIPPE